MLTGSTYGITEYMHGSICNVVGTTTSMYTVRGGTIADRQMSFQVGPGERKREDDHLDSFPPAFLGQLISAAIGCFETTASDCAIPSATRAAMQSVLFSEGPPAYKKAI